MRSARSLRSLRATLSLLTWVAMACASLTDPRSQPEGPGAGYASPELIISTAELDSMLGDTGLVVVDARPAKDYGAGHIPGAVNLEWTDFTQSAGPRFWQLLPVPEIERRLGAAGVGDGDRIVVYGDLRRGWGEDGRLFWMLAYLGQEDVRVLNGGWSLWSAERRPESARTQARSPVQFTATVRPELMAEKAWMAQHHGDPGVRLVDTRNLLEYSGAVLHGEARGGRIPGAMHLHWKRTLAPDLTIRPAAHLEAMLMDLGVGPESEVAVYCTGGVRSGHLYFVLKLLGYPEVRNYDGSIWEWAADKTLPME